MTIAQWKKIARLLKKVYEEIEKEAIEEGFDLLSPEYTELVDKARLAVLEKHGFTLEEYREVKEQVTGIDKAGTLAVMQDTQKKLEEVGGRHIPTSEEITEIAERVAQKYVVPPQITNQIVKEYTIEKPKIIETVRQINKITKELYDDTQINKEIKRILQQIDELKVAEPLDIPKLREELQNDFRVFFESNINILDMPNFRKLAMGLQAQIDALGTGSGSGTVGPGTINEISYFDSATTIKSLTVATYPSLTELSYVKGVTSAIQTQLDVKASSAGALTQFVGNTAWRVFYSNGSGDVTELALGADGTFLKSNGAASAPTFATPAGSGDVSKVGTPVNNQVGVWTGDGTLEGDAALTFDTTTDVLSSVGLLLSGLTASQIVITDASKNLVSAAVATYPSLTELTYVKGVTSAIQTQLDAKLSTATAATTYVPYTGATTNLDLGIHELSAQVITSTGSLNFWNDGTLTFYSDAGVTQTGEFYVSGAGLYTFLLPGVGTGTLDFSDLTGTHNYIVPDGGGTFALTSVTALTALGTVSTALTGVLRADSGVLSVDTDVTDLVTAASATAQGKVELATDAETVTGTDTARATTPANITAKMAAPGTIGGTTPGAATFTTITGTTITVNTNLVPDANDGAGLGISGTAFSDLFLASGAVINFLAGDVTVTHTAGILTVAGSGAGDLRVTTAGTNAASVVTVGGTQTLTSKTLTSPTLTTPSAFTTGGTITLAENTSIALDPAGSADGKYSGITVTGTAGATLAFGDLVYLAAADSRWELADADAASTSGDVMLGIVVLAAAADGSATTILLHGIIRADAAFPALTISAQVYVGTTAGDIQVAQPSGVDDVIRVVGRALTADEIYFNPSEDYITHT